ncbi:MAG: hypothetical protein ABSE55_08895 [Terracidiphilus sp.]
MTETEFKWTKGNKPLKGNRNMITLRFLRHATKAATATKAKLLVLSKLVGFLLLDPSAAAQLSALNSPMPVYMEHHQSTSEVEPFKLNNFPRWATVDMQLRARERRGISMMLPMAQATSTPVLIAGAGSHLKVFSFGLKKGF